MAAHLPAKREAERFALRIENELQDGQSTEPLARRGKTVAQIVEASLAASKPRSKARTYAGYQQLYATRVLPVFGTKRIAAVTSEEVEAWLSTLIASGREASTVRDLFFALHEVFRYTVRNRIIAHDPCAAVDVPRPATGRTSRRYS